MKTIAVLQADLARTPLGTRSRLADNLAGAPVLTRTVDALTRCQTIDDVIVLIPADQHDACAALLAGGSATLFRLDAPDPMWLPLVRASRKWSLDGWRGGIGNTTVFDEFTDPVVLQGVLQHVETDAVVSVPAAAPLLQPETIDATVRHFEQCGGDTRMVFTQAPPGVAGVVLQPRLVRDLGERHIPLGWTLSYKPGAPQRDLIFEPACLDIPTPLRHAAGRLIADTRSGWETIQAALQQLPQPSPNSLGEWLLHRADHEVTALPREVEIELTTADPFPDAVLQPRGKRVPRREPMAVDLVLGLAAELAAYDDRLIVLGGFGDPLCHPQFADVLRALRQQMPANESACGLAVRTTAVGLNDHTIDLLIDQRVDVLDVVLDAHSPQLYARLQDPHGAASPNLEHIVSLLDRVQDRARTKEMALPLVVPELTKSALNVAEMPAFVDDWIRRKGAVLVSPYTDRAGQVDDLCVVDMAPPARLACRRIRSRCMVLADGTVTMCDQDFRGAHPLGVLSCGGDGYAAGTVGLADIWNGEPARALREAHQKSRYEVNPLCAACREWHRP